MGGASYRSDMLRLWQAEDGEPAWRASLEEPHSGEYQAFADLEALFAYLRSLTGVPVLLETDDPNLKEDMT